MPEKPENWDMAMNMLERHLYGDVREFIENEVEP